jgi:hypothetical protein
MIIAISHFSPEDPALKFRKPPKNVICIGETRERFRSGSCNLYFVKQKPMKTISLIVFLQMSGLLMAQTYPNANDPHFASRGKFTTSVLLSYSTQTPPPAIIADGMYGISNKFSVGVTVGTTGALGILGIKANGILFGRERFKVFSRFICVYYPERNGAFLFDRKDKYVMAWMLTMLTLEGEWKFANGMRVSGGIGVMENHCLDDMKMWFDPKHDHHDINEHGDMEGSLIDVFTTAQAAVSAPLSKRLTLSLEAIAVFHKMKLIEKNEFKVTFPINPYFTFTYAF